MPQDKLSHFKIQKRGSMSYLSYKGQCSVYIFINNDVFRTQYELIKKYSIGTKLYLTMIFLGLIK